MLKPSSPETGHDGPAWAQWSVARRNFTLAILCVVSLFNFIDRQIISILLEPIRKEFHASDAQMGLLTGLFFSGFYVIASIPLARISDRHSRRNLIAACLTVWSVTTALGGFAYSFTQLAMTRMGTAIAEAGAGPASHSMISDLYPLRRRATMLAVYSGISSVGIGLGVLIGGSLSDHLNWRTVLIMVGVPGLILAIIMRLTVSEPPRDSSAGHDAGAAPPSLGHVFRYLWQRRSYRFIVLTVTFGSFQGYGCLGWGPTYFLRVHGLSPAEVGLSFGLVVATALFLGGTITGLLSDWAGRFDIRWYMRIAAIGPLASIPFGLLFVFSTRADYAFVGMFFMFALQASHSPPSYAISQTLAPPHMRAVASVIMGMFTTIAGMGLAPLIIGLGNDVLAPRFGQDSIRYSLALMLLSSVVVAFTALRSTRFVKTDFDGRAQ